jgi:hypothetical protein
MNHDAFLFFEDFVHICVHLPPFLEDASKLLFVTLFELAFNVFEFSLEIIHFFLDVVDLSPQFSHILLNFWVSKT